MASTVRCDVTPGRVGTRARSGVSLTDLMLLGMSAIWGVNFSVVKFGTRALAPLAFNGIRVALAAVALAILAVGVRSRVPIRRRDAFALLGLGVMGNGLYQILFIEGIARTRAGNVALVMAAGPAFVALIGRALGVERVSRRGWAGIALSLAGIALITVSADAPSRAAPGVGAATVAGNLLVLAGSLCWSLFTVLLKPYTNRVDTLRVGAFTMAGGAVPLILFALPALAAADWRHVPPAAWGAVLYSGLGALVVAYLFWYRGVRVLGPTRTAMYANVQPVIALLVAWGLLHEVPTLWQWAGTAIIVAGVLMTRR
jgi:drug/metabolite transporter (DMT)-like permease